MRFLVDNALSPSIAEGLSKIGHDAVHVHTLDMASSSDDENLAFAGRDNRILLPADTDFGTLLTLREASQPSCILFCRTDKCFFSDARSKNGPAFDGAVLLKLRDDERINRTR